MVTVGAALVLLGGCDPAPSPSVSEVEPFPGSVGTLEELGEQALAGLAAGNSTDLGLLRLTEEEHNEVLWPELPASDPTLNVPLDWVWDDIETRNGAALARIGGWYLGRETHLRSVVCEDSPQEFETFRVLTDCWVEFEAQPDGEGAGSSERYRAQLFKDVVERGGGYKIFRYYDELPDPVDG